MRDRPALRPYLSLGLPLLIVVIGSWAGASLKSSSSPAPAAGAARTTARPSAEGSSTTGAAVPTAPAVDPQRAWQQGGLRGTRPDGGLNVGFGGRLQPDRALRRLFDYYLGMIGQLDLADIRKALAEHLQSNYADPALDAEALGYFDRYAAYQQALPNLARTADSLPEHIERLHALRIQMLGAELTTAFFADEEEGDQILLQRLSISRDPRLDSHEKARRLAALDAELPAAEQAQRAEEQSAAGIQAQTEQLDAAQADPAARHAARAAQWGEQAADGLDQLDQERAAWRQRLLDYAQRSAAIKAQPGLDAEARENALQQLQESGFSATEQLRLRALEQAGMLPQSQP